MRQVHDDSERATWFTFRRIERTLQMKWKVAAVGRFSRLRIDHVTKLSSGFQLALRGVLTQDERTFREK